MARKIEAVNSFKEQVSLGSAAPGSLASEKTRLTLTESHLEWGESGSCSYLQRSVGTGQGQTSSLCKPEPHPHRRFLGIKPTFDFCGQSGKVQSLLDLVSKSDSLHGAKITRSVLSFLVSINDEFLSHPVTPPHSLPHPPVICLSGLSPSLHKTKLV